MNSAAPQQNTNNIATLPPMNPTEQVEDLKGALLFVYQNRLNLPLVTDRLQKTLAKYGMNTQFNQNYKDVRQQLQATKQFTKDVRAQLPGWRNSARKGMIRTASAITSPWRNMTSAAANRMASWAQNNQQAQRAREQQIAQMNNKQIAFGGRTRRTKTKTTGKRTNKSPSSTKRRR